MKIEDVKIKLKNNVKWEIINPLRLAGQSCGMPQLKQNTDKLIWSF